MDDSKLLSFLAKRASRANLSQKSSDSLFSDSYSDQSATTNLRRRKIEDLIFMDKKRLQEEERAKMFAPKQIVIKKIPTFEEYRKEKKEERKRGKNELDYTFENIKNFPKPNYKKVRARYNLNQIPAAVE